MSLGLEMIEISLQEGEAVFIQLWGFYWGDIGNTQ
jgi:hypothetical protein